MKWIGLLGSAVLAMQVTSAPVFRVDVDVVRVDVLVTDGNRPIAELAAADFDLRDRGVAQTIDSVVLEDVPLSVMLVLDTSSSVSGPLLTDLKSAASAVVDLLDASDRAAVVSFNGAVATECQWTSDKPTLHAALARVAPSGATALHDALFAALTLRDQRPSRALVLVFSDGADTASWLPGARVIELARRTDAVVYAVTLGSDDSSRPGYRVDVTSGVQPPLVESVPRPLLMETFLEGLALESGGALLRSLSSQTLQDTFVGVVKEFRRRYLVTYTPRGVDGAGWHPIDVRVKSGGGSVKARRGYMR